MDSENFGVWAMWLFWGSAIGGIVLGISWARMKGRHSLTRTQLRQSLQRRFEAGEISRQQYEQRLADLEKQSKQEEL